jgi:hypothetical protein
MTGAERIAFEHGRAVVRRRIDTALTERAAAMERARKRDHESALAAALRADERAAARGPSECT